MAAQRFANLILHPDKCFIVPCMQWSVAVAERLRRTLLEAVPCWSSFPIVPYSEYLGFILVRSAGVTVWSKPLTKFRARAEDIVRGSAPPRALI